MKQQTTHDQERIFRWCYTDVDVQKVSKRKSEIQDGGFVNSVTLISACTQFSFHPPQGSVAENMHC